MGSALTVAYIAIGYPIILSVLARRSNAPVCKEFFPQRVSVLLPVLNGERWICDKLASILALDYPPELIEVIVVSDGSTDRTDELVRSIQDSRVKLIRVERGGKPRALNAAMAQARGEVLFFTDVRQPLDSQSLRQLVACLRDPKVGAASGELVLLQGSTNSESNSGLYWRYEKWIRKHLSEIDSVPGTTGCIYAMRRDLAEQIPETMLADDMYLPITAFLKGFRVIFDGSSRAFDQPMALKTEFRRKVRTLAGVYQVIAAYPSLLGPHNRMWFHFVSHKAGRLILPWLLLINIVASFYLPAPWRVIALAAYFALFAAAALDSIVPEGWTAKIASSAANTFVGLMAATMFAATVFVIPNRYFWKVTTTSAQKIAAN